MHHCELHADLSAWAVETTQALLGLTHKKDSLIFCPQIHFKPLQASTSIGSEVHHRRGHKAAVAAYREHLKELGQEGGGAN